MSANDFLNYTVWAEMEKYLLCYSNDILDVVTSNFSLFTIMSLHVPVAISEKVQECAANFSSVCNKEVNFTMMKVSQTKVSGSKTLLRNGCRNLLASYEKEVWFQEILVEFLFLHKDGLS